MEKKLRTFLETTFRPYGNFPAREEVLSELQANLEEKYADLKARGKTDDEAYEQAIESFGDVEEIMETIPRPTQRSTEEKSGFKQTIKNVMGHMTGNGPKFSGVALRDVDLSATQLVGESFSGSDVRDTNFDGADLTNANASGSDLSNTSFVGATMRGVVFGGSSLEGAKFDKADLTNAKFKASSFKGASFAGAILHGTEFIHSDLSNIAFDDVTLTGVVFNGCSLKHASFKGATITDVQFRSGVKDTNFDGATMDKITYALLKGAKAKLDNVTIK